MVEIERQIRKSKSIPLISLIDVVFQLLIYFMISTSFTRQESLELSLPAAAQTRQMARQEDAQTLHVYISDNGETFLGKKSVGEQEITSELRSVLAINPDRGILVLSASKVPVELLVKVMDHIYTAGGKNIAVADWVMPGGVAPVSDAKPKEAQHNG